MEAMRALKRRLSDIVYHQPVTDHKRLPRTRPGTAQEDTRGRLLAPARPTRTPTSTLRRSHVPDPPDPTLRPPRRPTQAIPQRDPTALSHRRPAAPVKRSPLDPARKTHDPQGGNHPPIDTQGSHERAEDPRGLGLKRCGVRVRAAEHDGEPLTVGWLVYAAGEGGHGRCSAMFDDDPVLIPKDLSRLHDVFVAH